MDNTLHTVDKQVDKFTVFCEQLKKEDPKEWARLASLRRTTGKNEIISFSEDYELFIKAQSDWKTNNDNGYCVQMFTVPYVTIIAAYWPNKKFNDIIEWRFKNELQELREALVNMSEDAQISYCRLAYYDPNHSFFNPSEKESSTESELYLATPTARDP